ncbi:MAG: ribonuclease III [Lachnospiraceae bacterium]|nr:ribonuclease III [Lachnospiraceae bacterium]
MEEGINLLEQIRSRFQCRDVDIRTYSPLTMAYIGDAIYDLVIRTVVVERGNRSANDLHRKTIQYVKAGAQAEMIEALSDMLTEEEAGIYRWGRNAKFYTKAKNASVGEYRRATGMEALMGYLYMTGRAERMLELIQEGIRRIGLEI